MAPEDRPRTRMALCALALASAAWAAAGCPSVRQGPVRLERNALVGAVPLVGSIAPGFVAEAVMADNSIGQVDLTDYRGRYVFLFFYPADFSYVCPTEVIAFEDRLDEFRALGCEVIGVSVDSRFNHAAWKRLPREKGGIGNIRYPLVADLTKQMARDYGVLVAETVALRAWFLIDPQGRVRHALINDAAVGRNVGEALRTLAAVRLVDDYGEICPENWRPGQKAINPQNGEKPGYFADVSP